MEQGDPENSGSRGGTGLPVNSERNPGQDDDFPLSETELANCLVLEATRSAHSQILDEEAEQAALASNSSHYMTAAVIGPQKSPSFSPELARTVVIDVFFGEHSKRRHYSLSKKKVGDKAKSSLSQTGASSPELDNLDLVGVLDEGKEGRPEQGSSKATGSAKITRVIRNCRQAAI